MISVILNNVLAKQRADMDARAKKAHSHRVHCRFPIKLALEKSGAEKVTATPKDDRKD